MRDWRKQTQREKEQEQKGRREGWEIFVIKAACATHTHTHTHTKHVQYFCIDKIQLLHKLLWNHQNCKLLLTVSKAGWTDRQMDTHTHTHIWMSSWPFACFQIWCMWQVWWFFYFCLSVTRDLSSCRCFHVRLQHIVSLVFINYD